jgi:hypothetical protein
MILLVGIYFWVSLTTTKQRERQFVTIIADHMGCNNFRNKKKKKKRWWALGER